MNLTRLLRLPRSYRLDRRRRELHRPGRVSVSGGPRRGPIQRERRPSAGRGGVVEVLGMDRPQAWKPPSVVSGLSRHPRRGGGRPGPRCTIVLLNAAVDP